MALTNKRYILQSSLVAFVLKRKRFYCSFDTNGAFEVFYNKKIYLKIPNWINK